MLAQYEYEYEWCYHGAPCPKTTLFGEIPSVIPNFHGTTRNLGYQYLIRIRTSSSGGGSMLIR